MTTTCATCAYAEIAMASDGPVLQCRRYPPMEGAVIELSPLPDDIDPGVYEQLAAERDALAEEGADIEANRWPVVAQGDWCGEFVAQADETDEVDGFWHNVLAHPLLVLAPSTGRWLHERTPPTVPDGPFASLARDLLALVLFVTLFVGILLAVRYAFA